MEQSFPKLHPGLITIHEGRRFVLIADNGNSTWDGLSLDDFYYYKTFRIEDIALDLNNPSSLVFALKCLCEKHNIPCWNIPILSPSFDSKNRIRGWSLIDHDYNSTPQRLLHIRTDGAIREGAYLYRNGSIEFGIKIPDQEDTKLHMHLALIGALKYDKLERYGWSE